MRVELTEVAWLDETHELSLAELAQLSGLSETELRDLVDFGAITPIDPSAAQRTFHARHVVAARVARRLRHDFELDVQGLAVALTLLERVHDLEAQLRELRAQMPRRVR
jgi:chaperone modulatory protein CbpM